MDGWIDDECNDIKLLLPTILALLKPILLKEIQWTVQACGSGVKVVRSIGVTIGATHHLGAQARSKVTGMSSLGFSLQTGSKAKAVCLLGDVITVMRHLGEMSI